MCFCMQLIKNTVSVKSTTKMCFCGLQKTQNPLKQKKVIKQAPTPTMYYTYISWNNTANKKYLHYMCDVLNVFEIRYNPLLLKTNDFTPFITQINITLISIPVNTNLI